MGAVLRFERREDSPSETIDAFLERCFELEATELYITLQREKKLARSDDCQEIDIYEAVLRYEAITPSGRVQNPQHEKVAVARYSKGDTQFEHPQMGPLDRETPWTEPDQAAVAKVREIKEMWGDQIGPRRTLEIYVFNDLGPVGSHKRIIHRECI